MTGNKPGSLIERGIDMSIARKLQHAFVAAVATAVTIVVPAVTADAATTVTVSSAGDLVITGDNGDQTISIVNGTDSGYYAIQIRQGNALEVEEYEVTGATRNVTINAKGGDDVVVLKHPNTLSFHGNLTVNLGSGDNGFHTESAVVVPGSFRIIDGAGESYMEIQDMRVDGATSYSLGAERNLLYSSGNRFNGTFIATSSSSGRIELSSSDDFYGKRFTFRGGNNRDVLKTNNGTEFAGSTAGTIDMGGGNDELRTRNNTQFLAPMTIKMGAGIDKAHMSITPIHGNFVFRGDGGNDTLSLFGVSATKSVTIDGGSGVDSIDGEAWSSVQTPSFINWENMG